MTPCAVEADTNSAFWIMMLTGVQEPKVRIPNFVLRNMCILPFGDGAGSGLWRMAKKYKNVCRFLMQSRSWIKVNVPKEVKTYCPRCKQHQAHSVTLYKAGKRRPLAKGERHHSLREKRGYGGQKYPLQREFAKTTKKQTLKLKCKVCGYMRHKDGIRLRKLVIA